MSGPPVHDIARFQQKENEVAPQSLFCTCYHTVLAIQQIALCRDFDQMLQDVRITDIFMRAGGEVKLALSSSATDFLDSFDARLIRP